MSAPRSPAIAAAPLLRMLLMVFTTCLAGCTGEGGGSLMEAEKASDGSLLLASVDGEQLSLAQVESRLPSGLSPQDSTTFVRGFVYSWVDEKLMSTLAPRSVDMEQIEAMVAEYRTALIADAYRRQMAAESVDGTFAEDSLKAYYEAHKADFKLTQPMVKGVYIKIPQNKNARPAVIRKLIQSASPENIDALEKEVVRAQAIHYDYFRDHWVDWESIETRVPYDFASRPDFLRPGRMLEFSSDGHTYFLYITELLPSGSVQPYETARSQVRERLMAIRRAQFDAELKDQILRRAISTGRAHIFI